MTTATKDEVAGIPWWLVLIEGIALIIIGVLLLSYPGRTLLIIIQIWTKQNWRKVPIKFS